MGCFDQAVNFQVHLKLAGIAVALGLAHYRIDSLHDIRGGHCIPSRRI
jgi:hypothetical protein